MTPKIYYSIICPFSRLVRSVLLERGVEVELIQEPFWERRTEFLQLSPSGLTPVVIHQDSRYPLSGMWSILEFFNEVFDDKDKLFKGTAETKANSRYLIEWFCNRLFNEVTKYIIREKILKTMLRSAPPNSKPIIAAKKNLTYHMDYIEYLLGQNKYITSDDTATVVDISAACQLSVLDYVGDVSWGNHPKVRLWYSLMKSRPHFHNLLTESIPGISPVHYYANPDF